MIRYEHLPGNTDDLIARAAKALGDDARVIFAYLFGSLAKGKRTPLSDMDLAVYLDPSAVGPESKLDILLTLGNVLGTDEIDLVVLNTAPTSLTGRILAGKKILVDKNPFLRHDYESLELRKFFDFSIIEKRHLKRRYGIG